MHELVGDAGGPLRWDSDCRRRLTSSRARLRVRDRTEDEAMASQRETDAMRRALALAAEVDLARDPNPRVGAVVLSPTGTIVAEAAHRGAGSDHAEVAALALA